MSMSVRRWFVVALVAATAIGSSVLGPRAAAASPPLPQPLTSNADTIYFWNNVLVEAFRRQGGGPTPLARAGAMMHAGIFDALNSAWYSKQGPFRSYYTEYLTFAPPNPVVDDNLAVGIVARDLLSFALPDQQAFAQQKYALRHGTATEFHAEQLAAQVVADYTAARQNDGSTPIPTYVLDGVPGSWRPTGNGCDTAANAHSPHWGNVTPFGIPSGSAFRRPLPGGYSNYAALLSSSLYANQFNEVKSLGRFNSTTRTTTQTQIAWFWANDLDGTYKPPGQLLEHTRIVVAPRIVDPVQVSRIFALVSLAMGDAAVAAWDQKYRTAIDLWRPSTAIQLADTDNNAGTTKDAAWQPLSADRNEVRFSPCFPAWVSGHATFAAAWAGIMQQEFGSNVSFTATTEDPHAVGVQRTFSSFTAAATENARSRIYLGVHYQFDADDGLATGYAVANHIYPRYLQLIGCDPVCDVGAGDAGAVSRPVPAL